MLALYAKNVSHQSQSPSLRQPVKGIMAETEAARTANHIAVLFAIGSFMTPTTYSMSNTLCKRSSQPSVLWYCHTVSGNVTILERTFVTRREWRVECLAVSSRGLGFKPLFLLTK